MLYYKNTTYPQRLLLGNKYNTHKKDAKKRGIPFEFSFEEWIAWWEAQGKLQDKLNNWGRWCMCRKGDEGPYCLANVYLGTRAKNTADRWNFIKQKKSKGTNGI